MKRKFPLLFIAALLLVPLFFFVATTYTATLVPIGTFRKVEVPSHMKKSVVQTGSIAPGIDQSAVINVENLNDPIVTLHANRTVYVNNLA